VQVSVGVQYIKKLLRQPRDYTGVIFATLLNRAYKLVSCIKGAVSPNLVLLKNPMNVSVLIGNQLVVA